MHHHKPTRISHKPDKYLGLSPTLASDESATLAAVQCSQTPPSFFTYLTCRYPDLTHAFTISRIQRSNGRHRNKTTRRSELLFCFLLTSLHNTPLDYFFWLHVVIIPGAEALLTGLILSGVSWSFRGGDQGRETTLLHR